MGFEDRILHGIDQRRERRQELPPVMERAYGKAQEVLANPDYAIQERDFVQVYGEEQVKSDLELVKRLQQRFSSGQTPMEANSKKTADIFEAIMLKESELSEWFGNATTYKTAAFDDFTNKIDMIAEWDSEREGSRVVALATDVTFGVSAVRKKLEQIRQEIDHGSLSMLKYFKDTRGDFMGTRRNIPRTVIGLAQPTVSELAGLWMNGEKRQLGEHPAQREIAEQMRIQLEAMEKYASAIGQNGIAQSIRQSLVPVAELEESKRSFRLGTLAQDPVALEIRHHTADLFKTR